MYEDGDSEEMTRSEVLSVLCTDEEIANLSPSKTAAIAQISSEFDFKNPDACFRGMLNNRPTGDVDSSLGFNSVTSTPSHSFVAIKNESDADENYESSEEREAGGLRRDDCGRFLSTRKARRYSHSDHGSEDTTDGNSSIQNGKRRRRRTSTSNPIFGKRRKRTSSNSKCSVSESPSDNPSYMNAIDCTTPPLMTPVQVKGDSPQRRSDSVSESVISGLISISTSSETSPVISISNDSENASVEIIDCQ